MLAVSYVADTPVVYVLVVFAAHRIDNVRLRDFGALLTRRVQVALKSREIQLQDCNDAKGNARAENKAALLHADGLL